MGTWSDSSFFVADVAGDKVAVLATLPVGIPVKGPLQKLRVRGNGLIHAPASPMTQNDFREWRESLEEQGFEIDLSFAD